MPNGFLVTRDAAAPIGGKSVSAAGMSMILTGAADSPVADSIARGTSSSGAPDATNTSTPGEAEENADTTFATAAETATVAMTAYRTGWRRFVIMGVLTAYRSTKARFWQGSQAQRLEPFPPIVLAGEKDRFPPRILVLRIEVVDGGHEEIL